MKVLDIILVRRHFLPSLPFPPPFLPLSSFRTNQTHNDIHPPSLPLSAGPQAKAPNNVLDDNGEIEIDMNRLDTPVLRELQR
jgi:hypothetical protein